MELKVMDYFKVGSRVKVLVCQNGNKKVINKKGTIKRINGDDIGIYFDKNVDGHGAFGGKYGHSWWVTGSIIKAINDDFTLQDFQDAMLVVIKEKYQPTKMKSLDCDLTWNKDNLEIGYQNITKQDALKLADAIYYKWGE